MYFLHTECMQIRSDKNLAFLREDERFTPMLNKFDEPILNENAVRAIKNLFSFGKKGYAYEHPVPLASTCMYSLAASFNCKFL
jgi:hypothetical protein